jgi:ABC-type transport system involved in cytochrome c biogenesis permease component
MSFLTAAKHELEQVGLVTLYFMFCFAVILTLKKLFLAEYEIEFYALSAVVVGALVAGKIVVVLDHTPLGTLFDSSERPGLAAVYRALVYSVVAFVVLAVEKLFHAYRESGALGRAISEAWESRDRSLVLAKVLCVGLSFLGYHLFVAADRRLGKGTLWRALWGRQ